MQKKIPLIDVHTQNNPLRDEIFQEWQRIYQSGAFILGTDVRELEDDIKAYTGVNHSIACASGSDALLLPLMCAAIRPEDEVLVPSFTFYATAGAVARLGAKPVFVDSDDTYNMCPKDLERKITKKTKFVIPVHLFGQMADMRRILSIVSQASTSRNKIYVLEDCAQSIGSAIDGRQAGCWGDYGAFSFYPTKNLGAMGDAGLVSAQNDECGERLRMIRVHGSKQRYFHELIGVNSRLDSLQAAVLKIKLKRLPVYEKNREKIATEYFRLFSQANISQILMPVVRTGYKHVWNQFTIRAKNRDELRKYLADNNIGSEVYYPLSMHRQSAFEFANSGVLANCEALEKEVLSLPMYPELPLQDLATIVGAVEKFYKNR